MYNHTLLIRFNEGTSEENRHDVLEGLRGLEHEIPDIRSLRAEFNIGAATSYDLILMVQFDDLAGYQNYGPHEAHQKLIKDLIQPYVGEFASIQF